MAAGEVTVIKVGGNEVDDREWVARLAVAVRKRGPAVIVHGGGKEVTELQRALGAEPEWRDGLRVTTPEAMRAVSMVLSGLVNKRLVSALVGAGVDALGVSGEDAGLLRAIVARDGALGRTGKIAEVRAELLRVWLRMGLTPVISPVSRGPDGEPLNVNADDAAAAVASALRAEELLFVSNVPGVLVDGRTRGGVDGDEVEEMVAAGVATGGMAPKLRAAARAAHGVGSVRIGDLQMLRDADAGTRVRGAMLGATA
ncbi:MAG: argB [Gemmatimonadetes bacterium]|nr:argB [Gemmatimonadota bacterium]